MTNLITSAVVNGVIGISMIMCQQLHFILGLALFFIIWKFILPMVGLLYRLIAGISPFPRLTVIIAWLFQGGGCLAGAVGIIIYTIRGGVSFSTVVSTVIVISMSVALCRYAINGSLSYVSDHA
jgi:hypothetical protein